MKIASIFSLRRKGFLNAAHGFAAVEFGLALPVLALMLLGFIELDRYAWAARQLENTANSMAQMISQSKSAIGPVEVKFARDSAMVLFPRALQDSARIGHVWTDDMKVTLSSVAFRNLTPGCTGLGCSYEAKVAWSGGQAKRPCGAPLTAAPNNAPPTPTTLPTDAFGPESVIVVDIAYTYRPLFAAKIFGGFTLKRSSFLQPRYLPAVQYAVAAGDSFVTTCP